MQRCIKCNAVDGLIKSGKVRHLQRFYCKKCDYHFTLKGNDKVKLKHTSQITIKDLARLLGYSTSTISRALNRNSDINTTTRNIIIQKANDLGYKPNFLARSLIKGKTLTIGIIVPNVELPFFATVLAKIQEIALNTGYRIIVCHSCESENFEILNAETLISCHVDGLLVSHCKETTSFSHIEQVLQNNIPLVQFDRVCYQINTPKVIHQDVHGSYLLIEHLIQQGCKKIGIMLGPASFSISQLRLEGCKRALASYGIELDERYIYYSNINKGEGKYVLDYFLNLPQPPDGIFSIISRSCIEMMVEAKKRNIKIPEELAFVAFGDELLAELFEPSLTVFNHFPAKVGKAAIEMLMDFINQPDHFAPVIETIQGELIIRKSSLKNMLTVQYQRI